MKKITTDEFIKRAKKVHKNKYDYADVNYVDMFTKVNIKCQVHNFEFSIAPVNHIHGKQGCPKCNRDSISKRQTYDQREFVDKANKAHNYFYDYSKSNYENSRTNVIIVCPLHGDFNLSPANHLFGRGCKKCRNPHVLMHDGTTKEFIDNSIEIHDNFYSYAEISYISAKQKVTIICPIHGKFEQAPQHHLKGHGCSKCINKISNPEQEFLKYCRIYNTPKNRQVRMGTYKVDGFKITTNTVYEFLGDYWHGNPEVFKPKRVNKSAKKTYGRLYKETFLRLNKIKDMGYNVKYIWENDWKDYKSGKVSIPNIQVI